jgi:dipeptidyl aminopeptidase/acylaminoacyl peptidase
MRSPWKHLVLAGLAAAPSAAFGAATSAVREVGQLVFDGVPEIPAEVAERMNQYQNVRPSAFRSWARDGGLLIGTKFGEATQIHRVASPGAARRQLTFYSDTVTGGTFGEDPDWFLFNRDVGGNEESQIYRFDLRTGKAVPLTGGQGQNGEPVWSNRRDRIAWRSTARNAKDHDLWVMDPLRPEEKRMVVEAEGYWTPLDWSPDDRLLLVRRSVSSTEEYYWIVDVATGEKKPLGRHELPGGGTIAHEKAVFDRAGTGVFLTSDEGTEHLTLRHLPIGELDGEALTGDIPWSVEELAITRDRSLLAFTTIENAASVLWVMDTERRTRERIDLPLGTVAALAFSDDGQQLGFTFNQPSVPADVYSVALSTRKLSRWTEAEAGGLDPSTFRSAELVRYPTFDEGEKGKRRMIPAFVYKPRGDGPFPVIIDIHGGPESLTRATFSAMSQYYVNELGCAVIYPNVRGSSGFGRTWLELDDGMQREGAVRDIGALLDWIAEQDDLDAARVGVVGSSYGGFMVLASLTTYPERIRAGVDVVGISNFVTFLTNTADYRRDLRRVEYGDERDPKMREFLLRVSPTENADKLRSPLFVVQGANDPRVPMSEAEQMVAAVRAKGGEAWFLVAKDEGHGFKKRKNLDQMSYAVSMFWEKYLLGREQATIAAEASR